MREIEFRILPNGEIKMELLGFEGEGCSEEAKKQIERLGRSVVGDKKPEFYYGSCQDDQNQKNENRGY